MALQCEANGISESQFLNKSERVEKIEMFLHNFPRCRLSALGGHLMTLSLPTPPAVFLVAPRCSARAPL